MIGLPAETRVSVAAGVTDLRRGFTGLSGMETSQTPELPATSFHKLGFASNRISLLGLGIQLILVYRPDSSNNSLTRKNRSFRLD